MPRNPFVNYRKPDLPDQLTSQVKILAYLGVSAKELGYISAKKYSQYSLLEIPKRSGGHRLVSAPNARLKHLQSMLNDLLKTLYVPRGCVHGFVSERSALTNAQEHLGRNYLVKLDLEDYFSQVSTSRIHGVLNYFGVPKEVRETIVKICTLGGVLPQGSPLSPLLANMVTFRLDQVMVSFAKKNRLRYSRYADDIVLSSFSRPRIVRSAIESDYARLKIDDLDTKFVQLIEDEGFLLNENKLYLCGKNSRRTVTGYTINEFANVPRRHVRCIRAILKNIEINGYDAEQIKFAQMTGSIKSLKMSLRGRIEWIGATKGKSDQIYRRYALAFNQRFNENMVVGPDLTKISALSTWIIEANRSSDRVGEIQGSAFFLDGVGLVTAAHCLPEKCTYELFCIESPAQKYPVSIKLKDDHIDLAVLDHSIPSSEFVSLQRSSREINVGEEARSWGFPDYGPGKNLVDKSGKVVSQPTVSAVKMYNLDFKIYQGTSGGPILSSSGDVIGVAHKGGDGETHDLAVKISHLDDL